MAVELDPLTSALRNLARDDARQAPEMGARLAEAVRSRCRRPRTSRTPVLIVGLALAATLASSLWIASHRRAVDDSRAAVDDRPPRDPEIATTFMPLVYSSVPFTDARLVRMEVPRSAMKNFGLIAIDAPEPANATVLADVVVGEDGLARAVRFVRAPRAKGEAP